MENVTATVADGVLTLVIDTEQDLGPSKTGRSSMVATTRGFVDLAGTDGIKLSLNVVKPVA